MDHLSSLDSDVRLPPKFKMLVLNKFDGTSFPKSHLKMYMRAMRPLGATEEMLDQMFQNTLIGATLKWFLNMEDTRARNWDQYKYNIEPKESFLAFITKWRSKVAQMMNKPNEEEKLTMVVKNLFPIYHKTIKNEEAPKFKRNFGHSNSKIAKISNIYKIDPYQLIVPVQVSQGLSPRPRREFHELYMSASQVFEKMKAIGLLKPLDLRPILNPLPTKFDVSKRCAYHQGPRHDIDRCYNLLHAIQDLIDTKVIAPPTRPNITNNPLPNHNFGRGPRINCLIPEEEVEEDPFGLIYDILECFMLTWEELMGGFKIEKPGFERRTEEVEKIPMVFDNNAVVMMRKMSYFLGMSLGKIVKGPAIQAPTIPIATPPFGLGYNHTDEDLLEMELKKMACTKAKAKGLPSPLEPLKSYTPTLNGKFIKALKGPYEARIDDEKEEAPNDDNEGSYGGDNNSDDSEDSDDGDSDNEDSDSEGSDSEDYGSRDSSNDKGEPSSDREDEDA
ncbi:hypothetical protein SO802_009948 [Lithocarpus litseifolius]|uniref:Retrotransposon gag domain-containing protein n=1 Tax=Lithocarpus litseifolius TaxID=425828 RepID=A0AAW2DH74_9ROSI